MVMLTARQKTTIRNVLDGYAWPGGYPVYAIMDDGGALCPQCVRDNLRQIVWATRHDDRWGWMIAAADINYEDPDLYCSHCSTRIESAYPEED